MSHYVVSPSVSPLQEAPQALAALTYQDFRKDRSDLIVLRHMAQRMFLILQQLGQAVSVSRSFTYNFEEQRGLTRTSTHRIAMYSCQELLAAQRLSFVGFVSKKQENLDPTVVKTIEDIDRQMVVALADTVGLLSYSSLELQHGKWYNLVVFDNVAVKTKIQELSMHAHAAYQLAPRYYQWIRLHNGVLTCGSNSRELVIQRTKHYTFTGIHARPLIREQVYN